jgi:hypothetical protein
MRIKGMMWQEVRKWNRIRKELGYLPHYHHVGRIRMEVRFVLCRNDKRWWTVVNLTTGKTHEFHKNGTPRNGSRGRLVGPLIVKRRIIRL